MTNKMNPEAKAKIVAALRSGKYKQGMNALHEGDCFCVWGVICDISGLSTWQANPRDRELRYDGEFVVPPNLVEEWVGINYCTKVTINDHYDSLINHNDHGVPFDKLADAIEEQL